MTNGIFPLHMHVRGFFGVRGNAVKARW